MGAAPEILLSSRPWSIPTVCITTAIDCVLTFGAGGSCTFNMEICCASPPRTQALGSSEKSRASIIQILVRGRNHTDYLVDSGHW